MAKIYIARHGESIANTQGIYQGQTYNTPLSAVGKKQVNALARYFFDLPIKRILASPLKRTMETAKVVAKNKNIEITKVNEILETNHGVWEGLHKNEISRRWPNVYETWLKNPEITQFPNGEAFKETQDRVLEWLHHLDEEGDILVVTHDNIIRIIVTHILGMHLNDMWKFQLQPAAITLIDMQQGNLVTLNNTDHLKDLVVNLKLHAL